MRSFEGVCANFFFIFETHVSNYRATWDDTEFYIELATKWLRILWNHLMTIFLLLIFLRQALVRIWKRRFAKIEDQVIISFVEFDYFYYQ